MSKPFSDLPSGCWPRPGHEKYDTVDLTFRDASVRASREAENRCQWCSRGLCPGGWFCPAWKVYHPLEHRRVEEDVRARYPEVVVERLAKHPDPGRFAWYTTVYKIKMRGYIEVDEPNITCEISLGKGKRRLLTYSKTSKVLISDIEMKITRRRVP